jgi:hypothetical protein
MLLLRRGRHVGKSVADNRYGTRVGIHIDMAMVKVIAFVLGER